MAFGKLPLAFIPNQGQVDAAVRFHARGGGGQLFFTPDEVALAIPTPLTQTTTVTLTTPLSGTTGLTQAAAGRPTPGVGRDRQPSARGKPAVVRLRFEGARTNPPVQSVDKLPGTANFLIGNDPVQWRTNLPTYGGVVYQGVYPGVDVRYDSLDGQLKRTYTVAPGRDPRQIRWRYQGAQGVTVDPTTGDLQISVPISATASMTMTEQAPIAWQLVDNDYVMIPVQYAVERNGRVGFTVGAYDATKPLIIDPVLVYSTYLGGVSGDRGNAIAVDHLGNTYLTGLTTSDDFPTANPLQGSRAGFDAFVTKLDASGSFVRYSTFLGGTGVEWGSGIAVDSAGKVALTGRTSSPNFPLLNSRHQSLRGVQDAFVLTLQASGAALVYSTYLGGDGTEEGNAIAMDRSGQVYVTGSTNSPNFPVQNALQPNLNTLGSFAVDAFVAAFDSSGAFRYSTYLGGRESDDGNGIAVDFDGQVYVAGSTDSPDFPRQNAYQTENRGASDGFVTKINASGTALVYSTYLGGSGSDGVSALTIDGANMVYLAGSTTSADFPKVAELQPNRLGALDAFVTKLRSDGAALVYSTYLGGTEGGTGEGASGIAVDRLGQAVVVGTTSAGDFPLREAVDTTQENDEAFVTHLNSAGTLVRASTYLGGGGADAARGVAVDERGDTYVTGATSSTVFPTQNPFQTNQPGEDGFVAKIRMQLPPAPTRTTRYAYDGLLRLREAAETPGVTYRYGYDLAGNRTTSAINGISVEPTRVYDAAHQVQGWAYDLAGNLLNDGTNAYAYDALNRLQNVAGLGQTKQYRYNGDGVMMVGDGYNYTYDLAAPLPRMLYWIAFDTDELHIYGAGAERLQIIGPAGLTWPLADGLGSVRRTVDPNGIAALPWNEGPSAITYDPWGQVTAGSLPSIGLGFTGEMHDPALGLVHLRARWYNTRAGTFTAVDPFDGFAEQPYSQHPYQYAYSNPVVWTDPSGLIVDDEGAGRTRCIPLVERWDRFLERCVPNLGPPPPNNRLTNDAARSYAQAFDDLVGAPTTDEGILTTDVAIPYPGIGGFPRVGLPRIGLTPAQRRAAVLAALVALGCPLLTGDQADVRTRTDSQRPSRLYLYHYTNDAGLAGIIATGSIWPSGVNGGGGGGDATYGAGQYFTDLPPRALLTRREYSYALFRSFRVQHKVANWLLIDVSDLPVVRVNAIYSDEIDWRRRERVRRYGVYLNAGGVPLPIRGRLVGSGRTVFLSNEPR